MSKEIRKQSPAFDAAEFVVRPLTADDTASYRALRQRIRAGAGGRYFSDSYEREDRLTEPQWRAWCSENREHCIIGTFYRGELVGNMMITAQGPKDSLVCEWEATWLEPEYRKSGIAKQAYEQVHQWTRTHGYEHAVVFIREDNTRSRQIREEQGFSFVKTKHGEVWADGSVADTNLFMLDLAFRRAANGDRLHQVRRLETSLASMMGEVPFVQEALQGRLALWKGEVAADATVALAAPGRPPVERSVKVVRPASGTPAR